VKGSLGLGTSSLWWG